MKKLLSPLALAASLAALAPEGAADRIVTRDGRVLSVQKARPEGEGYRLVFENGEVVLQDKGLVASVEIEGDMSDYVPKNADEEQKLAQGYVKFEGKWLSKVAYEELLRKRNEESRSQLEAVARYSDWSNALTKETAHFVFKSNTSPELLGYYSELLESYYDLMDQRIGIQPTPTMRRTKMTVNVYKNRKEFLELSSAGSPSVLGYFYSVDKTLNFFHDYSEPAMSTWVALHECTHLLTYLIDQQYAPQIWLNEAVADFFGSANVERDKKGKLTITPGKLQTDRVLTVQEAIEVGSKQTSSGAAGGGRPDTKLEELFVLTRDEFDGFQYAHAWSFVYFLNTFENGKYRKGFEKFFKGLYTLDKSLPVEVEYGWGGGTGTAKSVPPAAIREYLLKKIGVKDTVALEREWKSFIAAIPIEGPEARLKRGLNAVFRGETEEAIADLDAAIAAGTKDARAYWARAVAKMMTAKRKDAKADLEKAIALDPLNAGYRFLYSGAIVGSRAMQANLYAGEVGEDEEEDESKPIVGKPEARLQAGLACELDPSNALYRAWFERFEEE